MNRAIVFETITVVALISLAGFLSVSRAFEVDSTIPAELKEMPKSCIFSRSLFLGVNSAEVLCLQSFLNTSGFVIAESGPGSLNNETSYFGNKTKQAVIKWQISQSLPSTGFFGLLSRARYFKVIAEVPPSPSISSSVETKSPNLALPSYSITPMVESVFPLEGRPGSEIIIHGKNFSKTGNTVVLRFGIITLKTENIPSPDGATLTVTFNPPSSQPVNISALGLMPKSVTDNLNAQLAKQGKTLSDLNQPYTSIHNEAELDAFLKLHNSSIKSFYDPYLVVVKNEKGESVQTKIFFKGLRNIDYAQ